jgi:hypothetical protein
VNIKQIEEALKNEDASPPDLAQFGTILAGYYSYYGQMLKKILLKKPNVWLRIQTFVDWRADDPQDSRDKGLSDKKTEMIWKAMMDGQKEIALEWELKRIEKMMSAINKRLYVDNVAAKNQY